MQKAISNTSPLFYLHQLNALSWLPCLFSEIWTPQAVITELEEGARRGYRVPDISAYPWLQVRDATPIPSQWLSPDLGAGELSVLALSLEEPERVLLIDERMARRIAEAAGISVWGTLRVLLEAKVHGITPRVGPHIDQLRDAGMWISDAIRDRVLRLADESQ